MVLTGRLKDIIIRKGENISAKEIEDLLYTHPKVGDVAVIGLADRERGELVCAVVEPPPGAEALPDQSLRALAAGHRLGIGGDQGPVPEVLGQASQLDLVPHGPAQR